MNPDPQTRASWPENPEQQWYGSATAGPSHLHPVSPAFRQAPAGPVPLPPSAGFTAPGSLPTFPHAHAPDGYLPQGRIPGGHPYNLASRLSADFPNQCFFDVPCGIPGIGDLNRDVRQPQPRVLPRRPAHWEDNPYPASFLRDPPFRDHGYHGHHCCSPEFGFLGSCLSNFPSHCYHPQEVCRGTNHLQELCQHWSCPHTPRRRGTLTYIGPPDQCPCHHSSHPNRDQSIVQSEQSEQTIALKKIVVEDQQLGAPDRLEHVEGKRRWSDTVKRWLTKHLPFVTASKPQIIPKAADKGKQQSAINTGAPDEKPSTEKNPNKRRASSSVATTSNTSQLRESSPTSDTLAGSSSQVQATSPSLEHQLRSSDDSSRFKRAQAIPRPPSTMSMCQCLPTAVELHPLLRHNPFDQPAIEFDIARLPSVILTPEGFEDDFLNDLATSPPARHIFINAMGDFPLERCQGDPDPSRSRNRERHLYPMKTGLGLEEKRTLPWPIRVTGTAPHGYITLNDVLGAIYQNFQEFIPVEDHVRFTNQRRRIIAAAYHLRHKVLEERRSWPHGPVPVGFVRPVFGEDTVEEGVMRCDYLGSQQMFCGLEMSPDEEGYTLFLGPVN